MKVSSLLISFALGAICCTLQAQQTMAPDTPHSTKQPVPPMPAGMQGMGQDSGSRANAAAASEQNSINQQAGQANLTPGRSSDAMSITVPAQDMQEPEADGFHTGKDLPAPELLREVVGQPPMRIENFVTLAETGNPTLAEAQRNVDRSLHQGRQIGLLPDPIVGYSGDHIRGGSYNGGEEGAFFSMVFVLGGKLALRRNIYLAEGRSNQYAVDVQRARVHDDVARSFFHTLAEQESVAIHGRLLKVALDAETNAHELERIGQADASEVLSAEIAAEQAKVDFEQAQRMFLASFAELATYAGQTSLPPHPLTGDFVEPPELDVKSMVATDMQDSPYVKQARANVAVAEARLKDAKRESVPNLNVKAGEWYSGEDLGTTHIKAGWESFAEVGAQLPLWNRNQGNTRAAEVELDRAHADVRRTELWTRNRAEPYAQQYQTARAAAERYRTEMLPRARRAYQLEVMKYQQMALAYPPVLTAQRLLFTLQLSYIHELDQEWRAALALQNFALMDGLATPISVGEDSTLLNLPAGGMQ